MQNAELIAPRVAQYPEVVAAESLVVPACGAQGFQALNLAAAVGHQERSESMVSG